jgi:hypothetical protein
MPLSRDSHLIAVRAVDAALWMAIQVEQQLMAVIESDQTDPEDRFQSLVDLALFSRRLVLTMADVEPESAEVNSTSNGFQQIESSGARPYSWTDGLLRY